MTRTNEHSLNSFWKFEKMLATLDEWPFNFAIVDVKIGPLGENIYTSIELSFDFLILDGLSIKSVNRAMVSEMH